MPGLRRKRAVSREYRQGKGCLRSVSIHDRPCRTTQTPLEGPVKRVQETISLARRRRGDHVAPQISDAPRPSTCPRHGAYRIRYAYAGAGAECFTMCRYPSDRITQLQRQMSPRGRRQQEQTQETPVAARKSPSDRRTKCQKTRLVTGPSTFGYSSDGVGYGD